MSSVVFQKENKHTPVFKSGATILFATNFIAKNKTDHVNEYDDKNDDNDDGHDDDDDNDDDRAAMRKLRKTRFAEGGRRDGFPRCCLLLMMIMVTKMMKMMIMITMMTIRMSTTIMSVLVIQCKIQNNSK